MLDSSPRLSIHDMEYLATEEDRLIPFGYKGQWLGKKKFMQYGFYA